MSLSHSQIHDFIIFTNTWVCHVHKSKSLRYSQIQPLMFVFVRERCKIKNRLNLGHCPNREGGGLTDNQYVPTLILIFRFKQKMNQNVLKHVLNEIFIITPPPPLYSTLLYLSTYQPGVFIEHIKKKLERIYTVCPPHPTPSKTQIQL